MEEEYKSKICISCINKVCNGSIERTKNVKSTEKVKLILIII